MSTKKSIAIDMDEVMAHPNARFAEWYERDYGRHISQEELLEHGQKFYEYAGDVRLRNYLHKRGFFKDLPMLPGCRETVAWLHEHFDILVVTAAMEFRNSMEDKYDWLVEHLPFLEWRNFVFCGRKDIILADYLIDDHVSNLIGFTGQGVLFHAPHNLQNDAFPRVKNWQEVRTYFEKELARQS